MERGEGFQKATLVAHRVGVHERYSLQGLEAIRRVAKHLRRNLSQLGVVRQVRARHYNLRPLYASLMRNALHDRFDRLVGAET